MPFTPVEDLMPKGLVAQAIGLRRTILIPLVLVLGLVLCIDQIPSLIQAEAQTEPEPTGASVSGRLLDPLGEAIHEAEVGALVNGESEPAAKAASQHDGSFLLDLPQNDYKGVALEITRPHFRTQEIHLEPAKVAQLNAGGSVRLDDIELERTVSLGFWVATLSFVLVLVLIALEKMHKTTAALLGAAVVLGFSFIGGTINPGFYIYSFEQALSYVDFDVIFLVMGMMIVIAVIEETGIFQWMAYQAYRMSAGRLWLLVAILIVITAVASALLDNVTTMLLMAPITIQIALTVGLNPLALLIPEALASNVGGISTLIGTPTNILIGAYAGLGFNDFLINLTPGVVVALIALTLYVIIRYSKEYREAGSRLSEAMRERLKESGRITEPRRLRKAGIIFGAMLVLFVTGDAFHLDPAVTAIMGAVAMLIWVTPDVEEMLKVVDWTTLVFFIALFISVGALQEVGLISLIAMGISNLVGSNLILATLVVIWSAALLSGVIDNIPFTATMLPVIDFLTRTIPGAGSNVLWYGLSIGSAMGGNSTLIGASPNLVTAGISERAGYKISYMNWLKVGLPAMLITVVIGTIWLLIRFF
jgi:Na+/H+ antiporter NhaD/arsenite permease-like protein